jgi:3-oxoacyl-[acyl-carrier protein] reductase
VIISNNTGTGGADGFGAAIVDRFSRQGWKVVFIDLNQTKGQQKAEADSNLRFVPGDVTSRETWEKVLAFAKSEFGSLDVVVNNAGKS